MNKRGTTVVLVVKRQGLSLAVGEVFEDGTREYDHDGHSPVMLVDSAGRIMRALNLRDGQYRISVERIGD